MIQRFKVPGIALAFSLLALFSLPGSSHAQAALCGGAGCGSAACDGKQPGATCRTVDGTEGICFDAGECASNPPLRFCTCTVRPTGPAAECAQSCAHSCGADYAQCSLNCEDDPVCEHQCLAVKIDCDSVCVVKCLQPQG